MDRLPVRVQSSARSRDIHAQYRLWELSEQLTGVTYQIPAGHPTTPQRQEPAGTASQFTTTEASKKMRTVTLGSTGLEVPAIGFACMGLSEFYGPADHDESD